MYDASPIRSSPETSDATARADRMAGTIAFRPDKDAGRKRARRALRPEVEIARQMTRAPAEQTAAVAASTSWLFKAIRRYPHIMSTTSPPSHDLRGLIDAHRGELEAVLAEYGAANPRLFGSVARGDAAADSDIDILVDLLPSNRHSRLLRLGGIAAGFKAVLRRRVDVVATELLREGVSASALADAIPL